MGAEMTNPLSDPDTIQKRRSKNTFVLHYFIAFNRRFTELRFENAFAENRYEPGFNLAELISYNVSGIREVNFLKEQKAHTSRKMIAAIKLSCIPYSCAAIILQNAERNSLRQT